MTDLQNAQALASSLTNENRHYASQITLAEKSVADLQVEKSSLLAIIDREKALRLEKEEDNMKYRTSSNDQRSVVTKLQNEAAEWQSRHSTTSVSADD